MKEINCNIIEDILPLYVDDVVSPDTKELVEEHLETCGSCRHLAETMKQDVNIPAAPELQKEEAEAFKNLKKTMKAHRFKVAAVSVMTTMAVIIVSYCILFVPTWCIPYDSDNIKVYDKDGMIYAEYTDMCINGWNATYEEEMIVDGEKKKVRFYYYDTNVYSRFVKPLLEKTESKELRTFSLGGTEDFDVVYYGEFTMPKHRLFKDPREQFAEYETELEKIVETTDPVWER